MFNNGRKTIGVLMCDVTSDYQNHLCRHISFCGKKFNYNVLFFTSFTAYGTTTKNSKAEFNIINLPPYEKLDAILLYLDSYTEKQIYTLREHLKKCKGPIVCLRRKFDNYYSVLIDDTYAISKMVHHFADVHHFKRIAFMSGPSNHPDSINRLNCYHRTLEELGLKYDESLVFEGDFWKGKSKEAVHYFTEELEVMPEAIICANDYMAISLCTELILQGFIVPDDIAISGFDGTAGSKTSMPPLTTLSVDTDEIVDTAMQIINDVFDGKSVDLEHFIRPKETIRNSCGCNTYDMRTMIMTQAKRAMDYEEVVRLSLHNTFTAISLESLQSCESIGMYLHLLDSEYSQMKNLFVCLGEGRNSTYPKYRSNRAGYAKRSHSVYSFIDCQELTTSVFETNMLLPPEAILDEQMIYFFYPLHHQDYTFGYIAIEYFDEHSCNRIFNNWLATIGNAIEKVRVANESLKILNELNNLYIHDSLTGLYNRRGFEQISTQQFGNCMRNGKQAMILGVDMDNLKTVNDLYGHLHGDLALKTISKALQHAAVHNEVCARVGGDEFNVIGVNYTEEKAAIFIERLYEYLKKANEENKYPYLVDVSYGLILASKEDKLSLEDCMNLSDAKLYEQKRKKKKENQRNP